MEIDTPDEGTVIRRDNRRNHPLMEQLRAADRAGLVLFSSGSTGRPKAILHSLPELLAKFRKLRHCYRTLTFPLFDHIGGFNTLFYTLANLGCVVVADDRSVSSVCQVIERHRRVELLPTSPSFLNLMLLSGAHRSHDLSSLQLITDGTEVMPEHTLGMANAAFPGARFLQTYGLSELGILRSKSESNDSLRVKIGGGDYETRVVEQLIGIVAKDGHSCVVIKPPTRSATRCTRSPFSGRSPRVASQAACRRRNASRSGSSMERTGTGRDAPTALTPETCRPASARTSRRRAA